MSCFLKVAPILAGLLLSSGSFSAQQPPYPPAVDEESSVSDMHLQQESTSHIATRQASFFERVKHAFFSLVLKYPDVDSVEAAYIRAGEVMRSEHLSSDEFVQCLKEFDDVHRSAVLLNLPFYEIHALLGGASLHLRCDGDQFALFALDLFREAGARAAETNMGFAIYDALLGEAASLELLRRYEDAVRVLDKCQACAFTPKEHQTIEKIRSRIATKVGNSPV